MNPVDATRAIMPPMSRTIMSINNGDTPDRNVSDVDPQAAAALVAASGGGAVGAAVARPGCSSYAATLHETLSLQPRAPEAHQDILYAAIDRFFPTARADFVSLLGVPQGSKFHAEGPLVADHYALAVAEVIPYVTSLEEILPESASEHLRGVVRDIETLRTTDLGRAYVEKMLGLTRNTGPDALTKMFLVHDLGKDKRLQFRNPQDHLSLYKLLEAVPSEVRQQIILQEKPNTVEVSKRPAPVTAENYFQVLCGIKNDQDRSKCAKEKGAMNISNDHALLLFNAKSPVEAQARAERMGFLISNMGHDEVNVEILKAWKEEGRVDEDDFQWLLPILSHYGKTTFDTVDLTKVEKMAATMGSVEAADSLLDTLCLFQFVDHMSSRKAERTPQETDPKQKTVETIPHFYASVQGYKIARRVKDAYAQEGFELDPKADLVGNADTLLKQLKILKRIPAQLNEFEKKALFYAIERSVNDTNLAVEISYAIASAETREWKKKLKEFNPRLQKRAGAVSQVIQEYLMSLASEEGGAGAEARYRGFPVLTESVYDALYQASSDTFNFQGYVRNPKGALEYRDIRETRGLLKAEGHEGIRVTMKGIAREDRVSIEPMTGPEALYAYELEAYVPVSIQRENHAIIGMNTVMHEENRSLHETPDQLREEGGGLTSITIPIQNLTLADIEKKYADEVAWVRQQSEKNGFLRTMFGYGVSKKLM